MNRFDHSVPVRDDEGNEIGRKHRPAKRVTVGELGGQFGSDRGKRLVVSLKLGDVVEFRVAGTRRKYSAPVEALYRQCIQWKVNAMNLDKARTIKAKRAADKVRQQIKKADARIRRAAKRTTKTKGKK